jgi:hypothetical protein
VSGGSWQVSGTQLQAEHFSPGAQSQSVMQPGVDVMITIFDNFRPKNLAFFSKTNVMIKIFCDFRQFSAKNWRFLKNQCYDQNFAYFSFV